MVTADQTHTGVSDDKRFAIELEFVQCLANPHYLNCKLLKWWSVSRSGTAIIAHGKLEQTPPMSHVRARTTELL